jgi:hypothetical protein
MDKVGANDPTFFGMMILGFIVFSLIFLDLPVIFILPMLIVATFTVHMITGMPIFFNLFLFIVLISGVILFAGILRRAGGGLS